ncbi:MAG TPA: ATP-binding protein [Polyangiaceae bacterium]|nr:ATP-binding protein [Polyangiaceae bacterium]
MAIKPAVQNQSPPAREPRMKLAAVTKGRVERPIRVLLYGVEGVGKSTFAAAAPNPIFIAAEDGTAQLDVARFPESKTWSDVLDALDELIVGEHDYQTVVVDTLDWLEPLCWACVVEKANSPKVKSVEDLGYGKGYVAALDEWRGLLARFEQLRTKRGMHVIFLAHSWIKAFKNPEDEDYDRYELKLHAKAGGLLKEWADAVLFARYETFTNTDDKTKRTRGVSTGARVVHTQRTAAWDAKNRYDLPATLPLDWSAFTDAVKAQSPLDATKLFERIDALLSEVTDKELDEKVRASVQRANGNPAQLAKIADTLAARVSIKNQENAQ